MLPVCLVPCKQSHALLHCIFSRRLSNRTHIISILFSCNIGDGAKDLAYAKEMSCLRTTPPLHLHYRQGDKTLDTLNKLQDV